MNTDNMTYDNSYHIDVNNRQSEHLAYAVSTELVIGKLMDELKRIIGNEDATFVYELIVRKCWRNLLPTPLTPGCEKTITVDGVSFTVSDRQMMHLLYAIHSEGVINELMRVIRDITEPAEADAIYERFVKSRWDKMNAVPVGATDASDASDVSASDADADA